MDEKEDTDKEAADQQPQRVSVFSIFRFASTFDIFLMIIGLTASLAMGAVFPAMIIFYGKVMDTLVVFQMTLDLIANNASLANSTNNDYVDVFYDDINTSCLMFTVLAAAGFFIGYIMVLCFSLSAKNQTQRIRLMFFESVLKQDMAWFDSKGGKDFASKMTNDLLKIETGIGEKIGLTIYFSTVSIYSIGVAFYYGWKLTLILLSIAPVVAITNGIMAKVQTTMSINESKSYGKAAAIAEEVLSAIRTVYAFGGQTKEVERYAESLLDAKRSGIKRSFATGLSMGVMWLGMFASYAFGFYFGIKLILNNEYTPKQFFTILVNCLIGAYLFGQSSPYIEAFQIARGAAAGIYDVIAQKPKIRKSSTYGHKPYDLHGKIEFDDVFFNYPSRPDVLVLQGLNLTINAGETVALVGSSGCGKSTVTQLLQRFYDPNYGRVLIDGKNIKDLNVGWLRDQIGIVGQEPVLFGTTIGENINLGNISAGKKDVQLAAIDANAHSFISKLPDGYDTMIGERGTQLSGGQKQRIAIARALIKRPKILLLDEATSALDFESEAIVQAALERASIGRTTLIIAHRLSTVQNADKIIVLNKGRVAEVGTHSELLKMNGLYYQLVSRQTNLLEEELDDQAFQSRVQRMRSLSMKPMFFEKATSTTELNVDTEKQIESHAIKELLKMLLNHKVLLIIGGIGACVSGVSMPVYSIIFGEVVGLLSSREKMENDTPFFTLMFLLLGIIYCGASLLQHYCFGVIGEETTMTLRKKVFNAYLQQEPSFFDDNNNSVGSLCSRLSSDASAVQGASGSRISIVLQSIATLITITTIALIYDWRLGLVCLSTIPLQLASAIGETFITKSSLEGDAKTVEKSTKIAIECLNNIRTVVSLRLENHFYFKYKEALAKSDKKAAMKSNVRAFVLGFSQCVPSMTYAMTLFYGSKLVAKKEIHYRDVFKVLEGVFYGVMVLGQSLAFATDFQKGKLAAKHIYKFLDRIPKVDINSGKKLLRFNAKIKFDSVYFSYPTRPDVQVLNGLDLNIEKGQTVALVGGSGCGKSTCIQLLERFYDSDRGTLFLDDISITDLNLSWLRSRIGFVQQEPTLFSYSIAENIAYGDNSRNVSFEEIVEAAKKANIHNFVESLPSQYGTHVGDKGSQLSGGQKQRIAIARALIRNPSILLLDEATSALDSESEKIVQEALDEAMKGRTCLVIAHRLSTIQNADKIVVLRDGRVVEKGTHQQLIARKGAYFDLLSIQN